MFKKSNAIVTIVQRLFVRTLKKKGINKEVRKMSFYEMNIDVIYPTMEIKIITNTNSPCLKIFHAMGDGIFPQSLDCSNIAFNAFTYRKMKQ